MFKSYIFAAVILFWVTLSVSLLQVQLTVSPVYKMRVPTYRSVPVHTPGIARIQSANTAIL